MSRRLALTPRRLPLRWLHRQARAAQLLSLRAPWTRTGYFTPLEDLQLAVGQLLQQNHANGPE